MEKHSESQTWMPLYIGKSLNVGNRINEHIIKDISKTTFAMKLKARSNLYGIKFRVSAIRIEVDHYNAIVPYIENELRNKYNPIVYKKSTCKTGASYKIIN